MPRHTIKENTSENIPKKDKPDFEAISSFGNDFYIFGSGSTDKRNKMVQIDSIPKEITAITDLTDLYRVMHSYGTLQPQD